MDSDAGGSGRGTSTSASTSNTVGGDAASSSGEHLGAVEMEILGILEGRVKNVSSEELMKLTPSMEARTRSTVVNNLLASGKIEMLPGTTAGSFYLRLCKGVQLTNATPEEQLVFSLIEETGRKGIWIRDIRNKSGLSQMLMRKVLKNLEQRKLVKAMKAVGSTKKCYILYEVEADESLTGGAFYSDQQFDNQFVQVLVHVCVSFLQSKRKSAEEQHPEDPALARELSFVSLAEVTRFVQEKKISRIQLSQKHIEKILQVALLDLAVKQRSDGAYCAMSQTQPRCSLVHSPCFHCPLSSDCRPGHQISPASCAYYDSWINRTKKMTRFNPTKGLRY